MNTSEASEFDVAVIGGGAAGLSAALVLTRARRRVIVIDGGQPRNAPAAHMQGFLSRDGLPPAELLAVGRSEVASYGGERVEGTVAGVVRHPSGTFGVQLDDGRAVVARRLLIATGLTDQLPEIPGLRERWAKDVLHCPYCHGYEVRDQPLGVLGGTPGASAHALLIRQWSEDLVYFAHTSPVSEDEREQLHARGIAIVEGEVEHLVVTDDRLRGVELIDGRAIGRTAIFVRPPMAPNNDLLAGLGAALGPDGWPVLDPSGRSTVAGVWVAGNIANPRAQVITAAGEGSAAAIAINADLVDEDVRAAVHLHRAGQPA